MNRKFHIMLDIDGVLATQNEFFCSRKRYHAVYDVYPFNKGCVEVFNSICEIIKPNIVLSSDWRIYYNIAQMNEIFVWNNIKYPITDYTLNLWNELNTGDLSFIEECRAREILKYVEDNKIGDYYLVLDDLDLSPFIPEKNFIRTPRQNEGIKQSGVLTKTINKYNQLRNEN